MKYVGVLSGGFCWLVNAVYIGVGAIAPVADAETMIDLGSPRWTLAVFGLAAGVPGYLIMRRGVILAKREITKERSLTPDIGIIAGLGTAFAIAGLVFFPGP